MNKPICFLLKAKQPTDAQLKAGNYPKKKLSYRGLTITIETPANTTRSGTDRNGHEWSTKMQNDYGYINRTEGVDGDHVDCYIGPNDAAEQVYIVHQRKAGDWEAYDEDKVMLGFDSEEEAKEAYLKHYDDPRFLGPVTAMPFDEFKEKVLATMEKPAMIKSQIVFFKSMVQPHLRRMKDGRVVPVGSYENNRSKHVELTAEEKARQGDLLAQGDTVTESRQEMIDEHEHLVDVLNSPSHKDDKAEAKKQAAELAEYKGEPRVKLSKDDIMNHDAYGSMFVEDEDGNRFRIHSARQDYAVAHPVVDGYAQVSADTAVKFHLNSETASAYPERNHSQLYRKLTPSERGEKFSVQTLGKTNDGATQLKASEVSFGDIKDKIGRSLAVHEWDVDNGGKVKAQVKVTTRGGEIKTAYLHVTVAQPNGKWKYYREQPDGSYKVVSAGQSGKPEELPSSSQAFDSDAWDKARDEKIAQSREAGYTHLDKLEPTVEAMRGKRIQYVHDNGVTGVVRTVDNGGNVYVDWSDDYSAEKEMASPVRDGKRTVMRSSLGRGDLKDYRVRPSKIVVRAKDIN